MYNCCGLASRRAMVFMLSNLCDWITEYAAAFCKHAYVCVARLSLGVSASPISSHSLPSVSFITVGNIISIYAYLYVYHSNDIIVVFCCLTIPFVRMCCCGGGAERSKEKKRMHTHTHERKDLVSHNHKNSGQEVPRSAFMSFKLLFVRVAVVSMALGSIANARTHTSSLNNMKMEQK